MKKKIIGWAILIIIVLFLTLGLIFIEHGVNWQSFFAWLIMMAAIGVVAGLICLGVKLITD